MLRSAAGKVMWAGRAASTVFGLALVIALVLGIGTMALAAVPGDPFKLGRNNLIDNAITGLVGTNAGRPMLAVDNNSAQASSRALDLRVEAGRAPMVVNADAGKAPNLNADKVDGKGAEQIGVNGLQRVEATSAENSVSPKQVTAACPSGKVLVGTGFDVFGAKSGDSPNAQTDVVVDFVIPGSSLVTVAAYEDTATAAKWQVSAFAICATAP